MSDFYHGARASQRETSVSTPITAESGLPFVVDLAPVHTVGGKVNEPILCNSYAEAVSAFGYSDDWEKYPICEVIHSHFKLYGMSPVVLVNVLDPETHKKNVAASDLELTNGRLELPFEAIRDSVVVKEGSGTATYVPDADYELFYSGEKLVIEVVEGGAIPDGAGSLSVSYAEVDPSAVTKYDVIGGYDPVTKKNSGFELIDKVFPKYLVVPDLLLSPGWSSDSEVAAIMAAKAENISGLFEGKALIDADSSTVRHYSDVTAWKSKNNIMNKTEILLWPMVALSGRKYHSSVHAAGLMAKVDADNGGCPCESPSNKSLQIDSTVLADGTEVVLGLADANYLNSVGVVTAMNSVGGFVLWGNCNACYPGNTDVKDFFIPVSRMFGWVAGSVIRTYWSKVDKKMNRRLIDSIADAVNIWLNGLTAEEKILGGRIEFLDSENSDADLMAGKLTFHIYMTPTSPTQEINFVLEYDVNYVTSALAA